jgi:hypothetical protein
MRIRTSELIGPALDWAVAKCKGVKLRGDKGFSLVYLHTRQDGSTHYQHWKPSTEWSQGGPIIERIKGFEFKQWLQAKPDSCCEAHIHNYEGNWVEFGPTPLIAAMRCYVASELGDEVDIPAELMDKMPKSNGGRDALTRDDDKLTCKYCGRVYEETTWDGLEEGDPCPSDDCPSHERN